MSAIRVRQSSLKRVKCSWTGSCHETKPVSGAVLSVINLLSLIDLLGIADDLLAGADLSMFSLLLERYQTYFGNSVAISGMLMMLIPVMLAGMMRKRTMSSVFWRALWMIAGCTSVALSMQFGAWVALVLAALIFFFVYSYKALSVSLLFAFPVACGAVWAPDLDRMLNVRSMPPVLAVQNVVITFCDGAGQRMRVMQSVLNMTKYHIFGVGWGEQAFCAVFPQYAAPGLEGLSGVDNAFLQLLANAGWGALLVFGAVLMAFLLCVMTYLRWGSYTVTKARVAAGLAGICGVLLMGMTCNVFASESVWMIYWFVLALTVACIRTQYDTLARAVQTHGGTQTSANVSWQNSFKR